MIKISPEVSDALSRGAAVVALESTIICHGMLYAVKYSLLLWISVLVTLIEKGFVVGCKIWLLSSNML